MSRLLTVNPVLSRELRQRVRSRRASVVLTAYLSVLVVAAALLVWGLNQSSEPGSTVNQGIGRTLFGTLLFGILGLVCFIVPGVAAGAVAGERERLTLVPLQVTLLTPGQVLRGKLLASLAFTTLLLVATLPLLAVAYVLGGVTVPQIAGGLFFVLASAAFIGVLSIWASTVLRRVQRATVVAYGLVGLLVLGTPAAYGVQLLATSNFVDGTGGSQRWESLLFVAPNPFIVTADALGHRTEGGASPFTPSQAALRRRDERRSGLGGPFPVDVPPPMPVPSAGPAPTLAPEAPRSLPPVTGAIPVPQTTPTTMAEPLSAGPPTFPVETEAFAGQGSGGRVPSLAPPGFDPATGRIISGDIDRFRVQRDRSDFTDRGPIWAWTFGWWALLGGAAYLHAARRLRLPSISGVRP